MAAAGPVRQRLLLLASLAVLVLHYGRDLPMQLTEPGRRLGHRDFHIYYLAGRAAGEGRPLYRQVLPLHARRH